MCHALKREVVNESEGGLKRILEQMMRGIYEPILGRDYDPQESYHKRILGQGKVTSVRRERTTQPKGA